jgi:hypothetical protein
MNACNNLGCQIAGMHLAGCITRRRLNDAAEDLLVVAKLVVEFFGTDPIEDLLDADIRLRDAARAAIAKAEGA